MSERDSVAADLGLIVSDEPLGEWHHQCRRGPFKGAWWTLDAETCPKCPYCGTHWTDGEELPRAFRPVKEW